MLLKSSVKGESILKTETNYIWKVVEAGRMIRLDELGQRRNSLSADKSSVYVCSFLLDEIVRKKCSLYDCARAIQILSVCMKFIKMG
jgi:hypothetical protein